MWLKQGVDEIDAETAAAVAEADKSLEVSTDLAPVQRDLVRLGRIVSTHWVQSSSARPGDRLPIGPTDYFYDVIAQLTPGQVARLTGGRTMVPATLPPVQPAGAKPWDHPAPAPGIPANLAPFLPSGASWVRNEELDRSLVRASGAHLYFDPASDTVYLSAVNLWDPNSPYTHLGPDGTTVTVTPSPIPVPS